MSDMKLRLNKEVAVTEENVVDLMVTALEGGIGYWCELDCSGPEWENPERNESISERAAHILLGGGSLTLIDNEDDEEVFELTLEKLLTGFTKWVEEGYDKEGVVDGTELDMCNCDADCADGIVQFALFDDIVYG